MKTKHYSTTVVDKPTNSYASVANFIATPKKKSFTLTVLVTAHRQPPFALIHDLRSRSFCAIEKWQ
jgi:hypothetical protein